MPALTDHVRAGFVLPGNRAADPRRFVDSLIAALRSRDVRLLEHRTITGFDVIGDRVRPSARPTGDVDADEFVLAAGAGLRALGRLLGLRLEVIAGQGYNVALPTTTRLGQPVIVEEAHAVATPFDDRIRLGGTMELAGGRRRSTHGGSTPSCGRCGDSSTSTGSRAGTSGPARAR